MPKQKPKRSKESIAAGAAAWREIKAEKKEYARRYVGRNPRKMKPGMVLHHNQVWHDIDTAHGDNGFRAWWANRAMPGFVECPCGWAGLSHVAGKDYVQDGLANGFKGFCHDENVRVPLRWVRDGKLVFSGMYLPPRRASRRSRF
jgi:hypothetical protein